MFLYDGQYSAEILPAQISILFVSVLAAFARVKT